MANIGKVKFQPPNVPVIFVLGLRTFCGEKLSKLTFKFPTGGPGSGKVTHCDTLMQEKRGVTHINMMDLLQQYAIGNGESQVLDQRVRRLTNSHNFSNECKWRTRSVENSFIDFQFPKNYQLLNVVGGHKQWTAMGHKYLIRVKNCFSHRRRTIFLQESLEVLKITRLNNYF